MNIYLAIKSLCQYGKANHFVQPADMIYIRNQLLELFELTDWEDHDVVTGDHFEILSSMVCYAYEKGIILSDKPPYSDNFESKVMNILLPRPSEVIQNFDAYKSFSSKQATDYYYDFSKKSHYIRLDRTSKNMFWQVPSEYGLIDITVNLSKPEKDPKAIAAAANQKENNYPQCLLCVENEGYSGHVNHPGRQNHRIIPIQILDETWFFQYSPYAYFNEHSILLKENHTPMVIQHKTFERLLSFVDQFPHYFIGSNADLPIVGGSMLTHDHYQCGSYTFPMVNAETLFKTEKDHVEIEVLKWPLSVLRLTAKTPQPLLGVANQLFDAWVLYDDPEHDIISKTKEVRHNTVTPIARRFNGSYQMDLVLRNNRTDDKRPDGIFHPYTDIHPVKKENIGLIEVMGLAVLPSRLKSEMTEMAEVLYHKRSIPRHLEIFTDIMADIEVAETFEATYENVRNKVGLIFVKGLEDSGVFKQTQSGLKGFLKFLESVIK